VKPNKYGMYTYLHKLKKDVNAAHEYNNRNSSAEDMSAKAHSNTD
jgi:hypothetical protein